MGWRAALDPPLVAVTFLTALPLPGARGAQVGSRGYGRAVGWFPLVGALVGLAVGVFDGLAARVLPLGVVTALDLALLALLSGGLHLDGLADAADGLFALRTRDERLAIMRAGGVGAYGVAAIALTLLVEYAALGSLDAGLQRTSALLIAACCGRGAMSLALSAFPYVRATGAGRAFKDGLRRTDAALALALTLIVSWLALDGRGLVIAVLAAVCTLAIGEWSRRQLGGLTGDLYGAIGELTFASVLVFTVALR